MAQTAPRRHALDLADHERPRVLAAADRYLDEPPVTITASSSPRSAGGPHAYFSEGDYWWPDPADPGGPAIRRDGLTNPDNFTGHRRALQRLSVQVPALVVAWLLTADRRYADHAVRHLRAWFLEPETRMEPHFRYAQAVPGRYTGRREGVIDGVHLAEVVRAATVLEPSGALTLDTRLGLRRWFARLLTWLTTHEYGVAERDAANNHAACWLLQATELASSTGRDDVLVACRERYRAVLAQQMAEDGSFPRELARPRPYAYSLFTLDVLSVAAHSISSPGERLVPFELPDGRGLPRGLAFAYPYIRDKAAWPYGRDVEHWDDWPVRHPSLLVGGLELDRPEYLELWRRLDPDPVDDEVLRNYPIRQPLLWLTA